VDGLSHIFLHVGLCNAAIQATQIDTPIPIHVTMRFQRGDPFLDKTFTVPRGNAGDANVEFDVSQGQELIAVEIPKYRCSGRDVLTILGDRNRKVTENLVDGVDPRPLPDLLFSGTAPLAFLYTTKPTFVALDKNVTCKTPIGKPLPVKITASYDQGAYYLEHFPDADLADQQPVFALRLATPTGLAHYIHLPIPAPQGGGWPETIDMNVTEDMVDEVATEPTDTLLCPKLWRTTVK
jgi:hypothetical protein